MVAGRATQWAEWLTQILSEAQPREFEESSAFVCDIGDVRFGMSAIGKSGPPPWRRVQALAIS